MASTYLSRTHGTPTNAKKHTFSVWVKLSGNTTDHDFMFGIYNNSNDRSNYYVTSASDFTLRNEATVSGVNYRYFYTNRKFRDCNGWYHIVVAEDTTQATASNRVKIYINGVQETSFSTTLYPSQNSDDLINSSGSTVYVGQRGGSYGYLDGSMSHMHFIDGTAYDASAFGEFDANGVWKIKTSPSVTYGNNGFFILKDGNSVTDQSGNSNNFTVAGGTLTKTEDNPSNVFATLNPLINTNQTLSNGNTVVDFPLGNDAQMYSTLAFSSGKYYAEFKINSFTADRAHSLVLYTDITTTGLYLSFCKTGDANVITSFGSAVQSGLASFSAGDIIGMAVDADNGTVDFTKNGSAYGSQVTGLSSNFSGKDLFFGFYGEGHGSLTRVFNASTNFGNGYFGTTAVTTAGTNASGIGIFEYDVPTGFTALSTKGLNL